MFRATINDKDYIYFSDYSITLKYDSIASIFSFKAQKDILDYFLEYPDCKIYKDNELLITGTILSPSITKTSKPQFITVNGYGIGGILEDCNIPTSLYPLQFDNLSLAQISEKILPVFGVNYTFTSNVIEDLNKNFTKLSISPGTPIKQLLTNLASQRNIITTNNNFGEIVFTRYDKKKFLPVARFVEGEGGLIELALNINSQSLHSEITVLKEASKSNPDSGEFTINNPYVDKFRPITHVLDSGDIFDIKKAARNVLAKELTAITFTIKTTKFVKPGNTITLKSPSLKLGKETELFVTETAITGNNKNNDNYILKCVIPEVYSNDEIKNIFT